MKKMMKTVALALTVVLCLALMAACGAPAAPAAEATAAAEPEAATADAPQADVPEADVPEADAPAEPATDAAAGGDYTFGVTLCVLGEAYWEADLVGMQNAADELGVTLSVQAAQNEATTQVQQIENFISQKVDAVICAPVDVNAILPAVKKCNDAGIPFVFNSRITESLDGAVVDYGVGFDIKNLSVMGAQWLADYAKENNTKLNILEVMGALSDSHSIACRDGLAEVVAANPDQLAIVTQVPSEWDVEKALSGVKAALQSNDEINAIYYHSDALFPSVMSALKQSNQYVPAGEEGHVVLLACGGTKETLDAMEAGYVDALEVCPILETGYNSVAETIKLLNGEVQSGDSLLFDGYIVDQANFAETSKNVFGNVA